MKIKAKQKSLSERRLEDRQRALLRHVRDVRDLMKIMNEGGGKGSG